MTNCVTAKQESRTGFFLEHGILSKGLAKEGGTNGSYDSKPNIRNRHGVFQLFKAEAGYSVHS